MEAFSYVRAADAAQAANAVGRGDAKFIAGGTTLLDLMKLDVERPEAVGGHQSRWAGYD